MYRIYKFPNKKPIHVSFFSFLLGITIWYVGDILINLFPETENLEAIFLGIFYIGLIFVPPTFLVTSLTFNQPNFKFRRRHRLLFLIPLISIGLVWTNPFHHLFFIKNNIFSTEIIYGPYFYFHTAYSYLCLIMAYIIFLRSSIKNTGLLSRQSILLFVGGVIPFIINCALTLQLIDVNINATLIAIGATSICIWIAIFKYDFLNIVPIILKKVVDTISDAYIVVDSNYRLMDYNRAFSDFFLKDRQIVVEDHTDIRNLFALAKEEEVTLEEFESYLRKSISERSPISVEKYFPSLDRCFVVEINPLLLKDKYVGTVILLKDITEYQKMLAILKSQNEELLIVNKQLADYVATVKELTLEKERVRIETEIHNLMGHNLTVLLRLIEVCKITFHDDPERALATILDAEQTIKNTMNNVRKIAKEISFEVWGTQNPNYKNNALSYLEVLLNNFRLTTDVNVEYSFEGDFSALDRSLIRVLYNICQEAMTNSLKHGKAKMITVLLRYQQNNLLLSILDDGAGCNDIQTSGMGLCGMQEMVKNYHGNIEFKSDENDGFKISVTIPVKGDGKND
jgi:signal transduction histidine kinase